MMNLMSRQLARYEFVHPGALPNVRNDPTLFVASDFGGKHPHSMYETAGILCAGSNSVHSWLRRQQDLRAHLLPDARRMSYKGLNDGLKRRALPMFLEAANSLNGVLLAVLIDKRLGSLFSNTGKLAREAIDYPRLDSWPLSSLESVLRATTFVSLLLRGLSRPGQNLLWFLDQDDIAANETRLRDLVHLFQTVSGHFLPHDLGHCRIGTTACDDGSRNIEDLAALPDLAIGALADALPEMVQDGLLSSSPLTVTFSRASKPKARQIVDWFADNAAPLRRIVLLLDQSPDSDKCRVSTLRLEGLSAV
jgi:hypothetical protein